MKFRFWLNILTFLLLALAVYFTRDQIVQAWNMLGKVNLLIFSLLIPLQFFSYYAVGEVIFSYLKSKGELKSINRWQMTRIALELNFVNHIIPVPSIAGFSYLGWILKRHGVSAGRATMAQMIRYILMFTSFVALILISVFILMLDNQASRPAIFISTLFVLATIILTSLLVYGISDRNRVKKMSNWVTNLLNNLVEKLSFGRRKQALKLNKTNKFFNEIHNDYVEISRQTDILHKPIVWAIFANVADVALVWCAFWSLGFFVNPAALFIAFGISAFSAIFAATPGGTGAYEAIMIAFLVSAGVPASVAIAGTLLARVTLFAGTIIFGYIFYQLTINKYGKISK